jgi:hypothetical protein
MRETVRLRKPEKEQSVIRQDEGLPVTPRTKQTFKFVYVHYPKSWTFDSQLGFLPAVKKIEARPGLNGCKPNGSLALTLARVTENGGTIIDPKDERLGEKYMDYVHFYPLRNGGKYYVDFNAEAVVLPNDEVIWNTIEQREQWFEFMAYLRDSGILRPMIKEVYISLRERQRKKINSLYGRVDRNPHLRKRLENAEADLAAMERHWAKTNEDLLKAQPAAKPKKRIAKKVVDHE